MALLYQRYVLWLHREVLVVLFALPATTTTSVEMDDLSHHRNDNDDVESLPLTSPTPLLRPSVLALVGQTGERVLLVLSQHKKRAACVVVAHALCFVLVLSALVRSAWNGDAEQERDGVLSFVAASVRVPGVALAVVLLVYAACVLVQLSASFEYVFTERRILVLRPSLLAAVTLGIKQSETHLFRAYQYQRFANLELYRFRDGSGALECTVRPAHPNQHVVAHTRDGRTLTEPETVVWLGPFAEPIRNALPVCDLVASIMRQERNRRNQEREQNLCTLCDREPCACASGSCACGGATPENPPEQSEP